MISVIVVNWNRREMLRACLESLARQQAVDFEVVVVDNGSADGSAEMVDSEFAGDLRLNPKLIRNQENRGFCAANNQGIRASRGEFVALLNNDAEAEPQWLQSLLKVLESRPGAGMAASKILCWEDPYRIDKAGHVIFLDGQNRGRGTGQLDSGQYNRVEEVLWPDGCAAMYRRSMLDEVGGFDEDFFAYADDAELGLRAQIAGWECWYAPEARVRHHRGSTLGVDSSLRLELIERNRVLLVAKLFPWSLLWLNGGFLLARVIVGAWAACRGQGETSLYPGWRGKLKVAAALVRGHLKAWLLIPKMLRKRRQLQRIRKLSPRQVKQLLLRNRISLRELNTMVAPSQAKV